MSGDNAGGFGCGTLLLLVIALLGVWSLVSGQPVWEWIR